MRTSETKRLEINLDVRVADYYAVMGVIYAHNGCCENKPYLLTGNKCEVSKDRPEGINYSCQCVCGCWNSFGRGTPEEAIAEYERMSRRIEWRNHHRYPAKKTRRHKSSLSGPHHSGPIQEGSDSNDRNEVRTKN